MKYQRSSQLFKEANIVIPGGVNSPVRAFKAVGGTPIFVKKAKGAYLYDEDGNRLIDYINSWGPMILGHAYKPVVDAVVDKAKKGTSFGMPTEIETKIAELAVSMVPNIDKIRFVNSGTEACMSAVRLARGFTGKEYLIKFAGCYHGHSDSFLIQAGSGAVTFGSPNSPGVTQGTAKDTLLAPYNNLEAVKNIFEANPNEIAAIIVEPVAGNMGCIPPVDGFLEGLRNLCNVHQAVLIFDIENLKISDKTIGTLNSNQSTPYIDFEKFGFDSGLPDESCIALINNESIESFNQLYWCGTQKNSVHKGFFEMIIILKEVNGINYLMLKNKKLKKNYFSFYNIHYHPLTTVSTAAMVKSKSS